VGRQPWVIYGHLRTAEAVSPVSAGAVTTSLIIFFAVYNVLLLTFFWFAARVAIRGPADTSLPTREHPGLDRTNMKDLAGAPAAPIRNLEQAGA